MMAIVPNNSGAFLLAVDFDEGDDGKLLKEPRLMRFRIVAWKVSADGVIENYVTTPIPSGTIDWTEWDSVAVVSDQGDVAVEVVHGHFECLEFDTPSHYINAVRERVIEVLADQRGVTTTASPSGGAAPTSS